MDEPKVGVRELFVEELAEVKGGTDPLERVWAWVRDELATMTSQAWCEEGPHPPC